MSIWYLCQSCRDPVDRTIEGELICSRCWNLSQTDRAVSRIDREIATYLAWAEVHCEGCSAGLKGGGLCPSCQGERQEVEAALERIDVLEAEADTILEACLKCGQVCETCEWYGKPRHLLDEAQGLRETWGVLA